MLSEKPIAEDVRTAESLIEWYRGARRKEIWSVAENFRFLPGIKLGSDQLKEIGGTVISFSLNIYGFIHEEDQQDPTARCVWHRLRYHIVTIRMNKQAAKPGRPKEPSR